MKVCDIKGCDKPYHGGGLCKSHYNAKWWSSANPRRTNPWTQEVKALVAGMLLEKMSASQIASRLRPGIQVSRNAVVGVVHRDPILREIGLQGGHGGMCAKGPRIKKSHIPGVLSAPKPAVTKAGFERFEYAPVKPSPTVFECRSVPMLGLKPRECRWAVNDAAVGDLHLFCGNPASGSYCPGHRPLSVGRGTRAEQLADRRNKPEFRRAA